MGSLPFRALIADDELHSRRLLQDALAPEGYEILEACDGPEALSLLQRDPAPALAILDWMMPGLDGVEVCRRVRGQPRPAPPYLILLTSRDRAEDIVAGLDAGADDYVTKPFEPGELRARARVGLRIVTLQHALSDQVDQLQAALAQVRRLQGLLPICAYCKKIRDDRNYWQQVESYIAAHSEARFSHAICPNCYEKVARPQLAEALGTPDREEGDRAPRPAP